MMVQNRVKINNNYILSFSMSNYLLYGGGTNLVVSNHQKLFNEHHISYVCVAPFLLHGKKYARFQDYWSLIVDGIYAGVLNNRQDPMAMLNALRQNNVDVAILWSLCKETYSYTYFECYAANVFVVTDENSGNIAFQVLKNGNGKVVGSATELLNLFDNDITNNVSKYTLTRELALIGE